MTRTTLEGMTVKGIKEYMKENNIHIVGSYKLRKAELIEALIDYLETNTKEKQEVETVVNEVITVPEVEVVEKIQLKEEPQEAQKVGILDMIKSFIESHTTVVKGIVIASMVAFIVSLIAVNMHEKQVELENNYMTQWEELQQITPEAQIDEYQLFWFGDAETILSELESINATNYGTENNRYYIVQGDETKTNMIINIKGSSDNVEGFTIGYGSRQRVKDNITKEGLKQITTAMQSINNYKHNNQYRFLG